jgi:hypothetical protein
MPTEPELFPSTGEDGEHFRLRRRIRSFRSWLVFIASLRIAGIVSTIYLLIFGLFEAYSALATVFDRRPEFPNWEHYIGWGLCLLPFMLIASLLLFYARRSRLGFTLVIANLCFYAEFFALECAIYRKQATSHQADWELYAIWAVLFAAALLSAFCLKIRYQANGVSSSVRAD